MIRSASVFPVLPDPPLPPPHTDRDPLAPGRHCPGLLAGLVERHRLRGSGRSLRSGEGTSGGDGRDGNGSTEQTPETEDLQFCVHGQETILRKRSKAFRFVRPAALPVGPCLLTCTPELHAR